MWVTAAAVVFRCGLKRGEGPRPHAATRREMTPPHYVLPPGCPTRRTCSPQAAQVVVDAIQEAGGRAVALAGDVTAPGFAERAVAEALRAFGDLTILVNNAGENGAEREGGAVGGGGLRVWEGGSWGGWW